MCRKGYDETAHGKSVETNLVFGRAAEKRSEERWRNTDNMTTKTDS